MRRRYAVSTCGGARRTYFSASAAFPLTESLLRYATAWSSVGADRQVRRTSASALSRSRPGCHDRQPRAPRPGMSGGSALSFGPSADVFFGSSLPVFKGFHRSIQVIHGHARPETWLAFGGIVQDQREPVALFARLPRKLPLGPAGRRASSHRCPRPRARAPSEVRAAPPSSFSTGRPSRCQMSEPQPRHTITPESSSLLTVRIVPMASDQEARTFSPCSRNWPCGPTYAPIGTQNHAKCFTSLAMTFRGHRARVREQATVCRNNGVTKTAPEQL